MDDVWHPIQKQDPRGYTVPHKIEDDQRLSSKFDTANVVINAYARPDVTQDEAKWKISKELYDSSGDSMARVWMNGSNQYDQIVTDFTGVVMTGASKANPCVITLAGHPFVTGDFIEITGTVGMTQINSDGYGSIVFHVTKLDANTFSLQEGSDTSSDIDSTGYGAWSSGGTMVKKNFLNATYS